MMKSVRLEDHPDRVVMVDYLLNRLSPSKRSRFEERFFEDDELCDRLLDLENDLLDAVASGELAGDEAADAFIRHLESSEDGRRRLTFARALIQRQREVGQISPPDETLPFRPRTRSPRAAQGTGVMGLRWLMPAAAVLTIAASGTAAWMGIDNARLRRTLASDTSNRTPDDSVPAPSGPTVLLASADGIVQAVLTPERLRGSGEMPRVALQPATQVIRFTLTVPEEFPSYDVLVERLGAGQPIARQLGLQRNPDKSVTAWVSSDLLPDGDYEILLNGTRDNRSELIAVYGYRIARTPSQPAIERPQP